MARRPRNRQRTVAVWGIAVAIWAIGGGIAYGLSTAPSPTPPIPASDGELHIQVPVTVGPFSTTVTTTAIEPTKRTTAATRATAETVEAPVQTTAQRKAVAPKTQARVAADDETTVPTQPDLGPGETYAQPPDTGVDHSPPDPGCPWNGCQSPPSN